MNKKDVVDNVHIGRLFSYNRVKEYHKRFIDKDTGLFDKRYTVDRVCPVCNNPGFVLLFKKSGGIYVRCDRCNMIYLNPVFSDSFLEFYYKHLDTGQSTIISNENSFYKDIYTNGIKKIMSYHKTVGNILDVGCGDGFFLDMAKGFGFNTFGVELCISDFDMCKKRGHNVSKILDYKNCFFDVVTMWDVFEHIPDPYVYLNNVFKVLKKDGLLFIQTPNVGSLAARVLHEHCNMFDGVEHTNLYDIGTISGLFKNLDLKFNVISIGTVISEIKVLNNFLCFSDPYFGSSIYKDKLLGFLDEELLHNNLLGYKFQIVLKKI